MEKSVHKERHKKPTVPINGLASRKDVHLQNHVCVLSTMLMVLPGSIDLIVRRYSTTKGHVPSFLRIMETLPPPHTHTPAEEREQSPSINALISSAMK